MSNFGIYIHWPFCKSKCPYCDFFSRVRKDICQDEIVDSYIQDIALTAQKTEQRKVTSVFFGGGTPSLLTPQNINRILEAIAKNWTLTRDAEISLEANPNTQTPTLFRDLRLIGINRLSLGVQSLNDKELKFLGRTHSSFEALHAADEVLKNFDNHSIDLMYALPNQSLQTWQQTLSQALSLGFRHLSLYQLTIEDGTLFAKKGISAMEEDEAAQMYQETTEILQNQGYNRYEVSNYAQKGFECRHNLLYWQGDDYVGIGEGAHGRLKLNNTFFATINGKEFEELTKEERAQELLLMGLRLQDGIDKKKFNQISGLEFDKFINCKSATTLADSNLIINTEQSLRATPQGFLLLNKIIKDLV